MRVAEARKRCLILLAAGLMAVASLLAAPFEQLRPPGLPVGDMAFRALSLVNPAILTLIGVALGCWLAPRVGLEAPLASALARREALAPVLRRQIGPALIAGVVVAVVLLGYGWLSRDWFADAPSAASFQLPLVTKLLYGGVAEELLTRWGLMTLFVWIAWKLSGSRQPVPSWAYWMGAIIAALLFAAGHLPLLFTLMPSPPVKLLLAVLAGNALPGVLLGWLYWKRGLEAAMIAHALAHLIATLVAALASIGN